MAKTAVWDWDTTAANNLDISSISLAENITKPSDVNNFERAHMGQVAQWRQDLGGAATTSGTNTITVTLASTFTAYATGQRFLVKLGGTNTGAATLNINSLGAKNIKVITAGVAADPAAGALTSGNYAEFQYDGTNMNLLGSGGTSFATRAQAATATSTTTALNPDSLAQERGFSNDPFINLSLTCSVGSSALTIALKGQDGNDPSATNPVYVAFRSATAATGQSSQLSVTAATSLVVSSGSTLGTSNGVAATLAVVGFNDAGTFRLGIINPTSLPLIDTIASSTAEGGAGAADSAGVYYTGTAVTSKAFTVLGFITITEATAGTWASAPTTVQVAPSPVVTNAISPGAIKIATPIASTSGTSIDFTGLPPWIRRITVALKDVSTNGTGVYLIQIGDSGGVETSGYVAAASVISSGGIVSTNSTSGFIICTSPAAATIMGGVVTLTLMDATNQVWAYNGVLCRTDSVVNYVSGGTKALSPGPLDRVRITNGSGDTFDAGTIYLTYE